ALLEPFAQTEQRAEAAAAQVLDRGQVHDDLAGTVLPDRVEHLLAEFVHEFKIAAAHLRLGNGQHQDALLRAGPDMAELWFAHGSFHEVSQRASLQLQMSVPPGPPGYKRDSRGNVRPAAGCLSELRPLCNARKAGGPCPPA